MSGLEFLEVSLEAVCLVDGEGRFRDLNPAMEAALGYPRGELIGQPYARILHPDEVERSATTVALLFQGTRMVEDVTRCLTRNGSTRWMQWRARKLAKEDLLLVTSRDVTQTRLEASLAEERARVAAFLLDQELRWTREAHAVFETTPDEQPRSLEAIVGYCLPSERPRLEEALRQPFFDLQVEAITRRGQGRWLRFAGEAVGDRVLGIVEDVTMRRHELEGLKQYRWLLERAQELAEVGAWWTDPTNSGRLYWSRGCFSIFGHTPETFDGQVETFFAMVHDEDRERVRQASLEALEGTKTYDVIHRIRRTNGEERWVHQKAEVLRDARGEPIQFVGLCQDITAQVQLQAQVVQAQKLESLGLLAGGIAHDFNNLLMAILGNAGLARLELDPEHPVSVLLRNIETASEQAAELCRQMLAYSGRAHFVLGPVDLSELVREMSQLLKIGLSKKVELKLELAGDLPSVEAEASQLRQVVMNLITNGSEAIGERQGTITLLTRLERRLEPLPVRHEQLPPGDYVVLEVRDNGAGMDAATLEKIFDPFFTTKFTGRGLGLAGVAGIVRGHRGGLEVFSRPGEGTVFRVYFPACPHEQRPVPPRPSRKLLAGSGKVLVVDDEPQVCRLACSILRRSGFEVSSATDGIEALELPELEQMRLVLLDLAMPRLNGHETLARLRERGLRMPVILTSGHLGDEEMRPEWEPVYRLAKPYRPEELVREVLEALESVEARL